MPHYNLQIKLIIYSCRWHHFMMSEDPESTLSKKNCLISLVPWRNLLLGWHRLRLEPGCFSFESRALIGWRGGNIWPLQIWTDIYCLMNEKIRHGLFFSVGTAKQNPCSMRESSVIELCSFTLSTMNKEYPCSFSDFFHREWHCVLNAGHQYGFISLNVDRCRNRATNKELPMLSMRDLADHVIYTVSMSTISKPQWTCLLPAPDRNNRYLMLDVVLSCCEALSGNTWNKAIPLYLCMWQAQANLQNTGKPAVLFFVKSLSNCSIWHEDYSTL